MSVNGVISPVPSKGDTGFGITTAGVTSYSSGTFANNNNGRGWEWVYVPFTLSLSQEVPITISAISSGYHQWVSFDINHLQLLYGGMTEELLEQSLAETITSGNALLDKPMNEDARSQLIAAITAAENVGANDDLEAIFNQLDAAYTTALASADAYQPLVDEIQAVTAKVEGTSSSTGQSAYNSAMNQLTSEMNAGAFNDDAIAEQVIRAKGILTHYLLADIVNSQQEEADITFILQNPDFTTAAQNGWTTTPAGALGYECHEFFNTNFNIYQTLYGLPKGTYTLTTQAYYRSGSNADLQNPPLALNAKLYINSTTADIMSIVEGASAAENKSGGWVDYQNGTQTPDNMEAASYAFNTLGAYQPTETYNTVTVEVTNDGENLELGAKKETTIVNDWTIFNHFRLSFTPAPVEATPGDADGSTVVDISDVVAMINHIISNGLVVESNADLDGDSAVNVSDVVILINWIVSSDSAQGDDDPTPDDSDTVTITEGEGSGPGIADVKMRF